MASTKQSNGADNGNKLPPMKRIIVCCDGTWQNSDSGYDEKKHALVAPTNVTRFARALRSEDRRKGVCIPQIVYYQAGVGTGTGMWDQYGGGAAGIGLDEHIREAYAFIAKNWNPSRGDQPADEIYLIGFSRGAFTARSIAGFISNVGLLTNAGLEHFYRIFMDYEHMNPLAGEKPWKNPVHDLSLKVPDDLLPLGSHQNEYYEYLRDGPKGSNNNWVPLTSATIPTIKAVGVWDTVGSLGIPGAVWLDYIKRILHRPSQCDELKFYDTDLSPNVEYAFQALAMDEMRYCYEPAVWERQPNVKTKFKQVWFPGVHSNIGGGLDEPELANITLAWMMSQLDFQGDGLDFDEEYIKTQFSATCVVEEQQNLFQKMTSFMAPSPSLKVITYPPRPWVCGKINTAQAFFTYILYAIAGNHYVRTPGQYLQIDPSTGWPKKDDQNNDIPLKDTQERIHPCVRIRLVRNTPKDIGGLGLNDQGTYKAEALTPHKLWNFRGAARHPWKVEMIEDEEDDKYRKLMQADFPDEPLSTIIWRPIKPVGQAYPQAMIEEVMGKYEHLLLKMSLEKDKTWAEWMRILPPNFS